MAVFARTPQEPIPGRRKRALAASASLIRTTKIGSLGRTTTGGEKWQRDVFDLYGQIPELRYAATQVARAASKARLFAALDPAGGEEPEPLPESHPAQQLVTPIDPRGQLLERMALHLFLIGETILLGLPPDGEDGAPIIDPNGYAPEEIRWGAYSPSRITESNGKLEVPDGRGGTRRYASEEIVAIRVWRPHPDDETMADSPVRSCIPVLRELVQLGKDVSARVESRLIGAGLLLFPDEAFADEEEEQEFQRELIATASTAIKDRESAAALIPLLSTLPAELIDKVRLLTFATELAAEARELREEAVRRFATGADMPAEVLLGMGDSSHWSGWLVDQNNVTVHIEPLLALIADALTIGYLQPTLDDPTILCWYDSSDLRLKPDRSADAEWLYDKGLISAEWAREAKGFDESTSPAPTEQLVQTLTSAMGQAPATLLPFVLRILGADEELIELADKIALGARGDGGQPPTEEDEEPPVDDPAGERGVPRTDPQESPEPETTDA